MEKRGVSPVVIVCLIMLGVLAGQSTADVTCYLKCMAMCIAGGGSASSCAVSCLKECLLHYSYCQLGCATALCSDISNEKDLGKEKVGACLDSCSMTCTNTTMCKQCE